MADKNTKEMSFLDHLEELRWILVRSVFNHFSYCYYRFFL